MEKLNSFNIDKVLNSYLETLLFADGNLDEYAISNISTETIEKSKADIVNFITEINKSNEAIKEANTYTDELLGHKFLLSRNGHGAGFFDEWNDILQDICRKTPEINAYVGDDNKIYII